MIDLQLWEEFKKYREEKFEIINYLSQIDITLKLMVPELTIEAFFDWVSSREKTSEFHLGKKFKTNGGWDATIVYIGERQLGVIHHVPKHWHGDGGEEFNWHMKDGTTTYGKGKYDFVKQPSNSLDTTLSTQANQEPLFDSEIKGKVLTQQDLESAHQQWKNKPDEEA